MEKTRPLGVTILAILAILGAINALIYTLQMLHILPVFIGPIAFFEFSLIGAFFWGLLFFIWLWVFRMLWEVNPQGWMFMMVLSLLNLVFGIINVIGASSWQAMAPIIIISGLVFIYCMMPGTKEAFGVPQ
ncbi:MAG: hypothetical protein MUF37_02500 [Methanoregulaceae archaeon]|jgi:hypothetical protein|nr:hypothetical protein [Methanoregulaceae archaeon]